MLVSFLIVLCIMCPLQGFYHFGVENSVNNLFSDLVFCEKRGKDRRLHDKSSVYGCSVAAQINADLGGNRAYDPANSFYVLGEDACQPFYNAQRSVNLIFFK